MRAVVQRCSRASVRVDGEVTGTIAEGLLVFLGVAPEDTEADAARLAAKVVRLRIFDDDDGRMNRSVAECGGSVLCVSQFTLHADVRRGNRPAFTGAAPPEVAEPLYEAFRAAIEAEGVACPGGRFGAHMVVELVNDGPVTIILDTDDLARARRGGVR
jgi:D-tyrosyl-tRNA(Tyr) deacylase